MGHVRGCALGLILLASGMLAVFFFALSGLDGVSFQTGLGPGLKLDVKSGSAQWADARLRKLLNATRSRQWRLCGPRFHGFMQEYSMAQASLLNVSSGSPQPPRSIAYRCRENSTGGFTRADEICGGVGDRLVGLIGSYLLALGSDRTFLIDWEMLTDSFVPHTYNWVFPRQMKSLDESAASVVMGFISNACVLSLLPPSAQKAEVAVYSLQTNRGCVHDLYNASSSPTDRWVVILRERLGLNPETAFGCLFHSLFTPSDRLIATFGKYAQILLDPNVFAIGIHVRLGDHYMARNLSVTHVLDGISNIWEAAEAIANQEALPHQRVVWLFLSDSSALRVGVKAAFPDRVLLTDVLPTHINKFDVLRGQQIDQSEHVLPPSSPRAASLDSLGEWWLLSLCRYFIGSSGSGYQRTAYATSLWTEAMKEQQPYHQGTVLKFDTLTTHLTTAAGVR